MPLNTDIVSSYLESVNEQPSLPIKLSFLIIIFTVASELFIFMQAALIVLLLV